VTVDRSHIRQIVSRALRDAGDESPFGDTDPLVVTDRLSSLDVVNILVELEQAFGVEIHADEFDVLRFDTVESIADLIDEAAG
jgi:acyl carrier protein